MITSYLSDAVRSAVAEAGFEAPEAVTLETPRDRSHGDLATNVALQLASQARKPPRQVAEAILARLTPRLDTEKIRRTSVAGPGFINFEFAPRLVHQGLADILAAGADYGRTDWGRGRRVLLEFVSANPTGPLNVVSARAAALGDTLTRLHRACGFQADAEFYVNDAGNQVRLLGESLIARMREADGSPLAIPENGYHGEYLKVLAEELGAERRAQLLRDEAAAPGTCSRLALERITGQQREDLELFRVRFDRFYLETELHGEGRVDAALADLRSRGFVDEREGALWFRSTEFGDDKDRVVVRSNGEPTYFLPDIAYHRTKHERGYGQAIDFFGPDHHGAIARLKAAMIALGYAPDWLDVLIVQQVNLVRGGEVVDMSKRAGNMVTLRELVDEVGADVARFFFLMRSVSTHLDFDLDLAREQSDKNPVFYVQYAHARACSVQRFAAENAVDGARADLSLLVEPEEMELIKVLLQLPLAAELAVRFREPQRMTAFLTQVAQAFHPFYHKHRVVTDAPALSGARLRLVEAMRTVLSVGLGWIGVSAPETM